MKLTLCALLLVLASETYAEAPGVMPMSINVEHHDALLTGQIFYPTDAMGDIQIFGRNPVFLGVAGQPDAGLRGGEHPVVLLSHGLGGTVRSLGWLAQGLAARGAIVVSVNHPNSTWGDFDVAGATEHWTRAQDMSAALDYLASLPNFGEGIDQSRVMAAGFSLGGWTALSLGGVEGNLEGYRAHCNLFAEASAHCADLLRASVSLTDYDEMLWNASYRDTRFTHVTAIDPGLTWGLTLESTERAIDNLRLIALGAGSERLFATNFDASGLHELLPNAETDRIAPATHFTALPVCTLIGAEVLAEEGEPPVCTDPEGVDRREVHAMIIDLIAADLGL
ncbi:MAG: hypothetical protein AAF709_26205 [Pseudomonadota bacterium]